MRELNQAMEWLNQYHSKEPRLGLSRVRALAKLVGNPELKSKVIHVAGTNGKGSTVSFLSNLIQALGLKVGVFSSPYITQYEEQFMINGQPMAHQTLIEYVTKYKTIFETYADIADIKGLTEFELITVLAYDYFANEAVDVVIMEVGLGGKEDSTNICQPILTGITTIGLDHVDILGHSLATVAEQKAGIIKAQAPLVTGRIELEALDVIKAIAQTQQVEHYQFLQDYQGEYLVSDDIHHTRFNYWSGTLSDTNFSIPLVGKHQVDNASMAIQLFEVFCQMEGLTYNPTIIQKGLSQTTWPARLEIISKNPLIIIDGAHNPHAMARLIENMNTIYGNYQKDILFTCIRTKDIESMVQEFSQMHPETLTMTTFEHENAFSIEELRDRDYSGVCFEESWKHFLNEYLDRNSNKNRLLLVTGSLYFLSQVRPYLIQQLNKETE